ncbi:hypothetical protein [Streptomyces chartreusis]|uniref:hypothetical protein n=1 Tax=Streptomyces chartreusis TaxID=1969 RepID=UPI0036695371
MRDELDFQTAQRGVIIAGLSVSLLGMGTSAQATPSAKSSEVASGNRAIIASGRGRMTLRIDDTRSTGTVLSKHIDARSAFRACPEALL